MKQPTNVAGISAEAASIPDLKAFLEDAAPFDQVQVKTPVRIAGNGRLVVNLPPLWLYCPSEACAAPHQYDPDSPNVAFGNGAPPTAEYCWIPYHCRHCNAEKVYSVWIGARSDAVQKDVVQLIKYAEDPPALGPTPQALRSLLSTDWWQLYVRGRRAELAGLGIGAFAYYRRVVENVWSRILDRLIDVATLDGAAERLTTLTSAKAEREFTRSMEVAQAAIPPSLYVDRHNPIQALYDACGNAIHEYDDAECIRRSKILRLVLTRVAERAQAILEEDSEFRAAVGTLSNPAAG